MSRATRMWLLASVVFVFSGEGWAQFRPSGPSSMLSRPSGSYGPAPRPYTPSVSPYSSRPYGPPGYSSPPAPLNYYIPPYYGPPSVQYGPQYQVAPQYQYVPQYPYPPQYQAAPQYPVAPAQPLAQTPYSDVSTNWQRRNAYMTGTNGQSIPNHAEMYRLVKGWLEYRPALAPQARTERDNRVKAKFAEYRDGKEALYKENKARSLKEWTDWFASEEPSFHSEWYKQQVKELDQALQREFGDKEIPERLRAPILSKLNAELESRGVIFKTMRDSLNKEYDFRDAKIKTNLSEFMDGLSALKKAGDEETNLRSGVEAVFQAADMKFNKAVEVEAARRQSAVKGIHDIFVKGSASWPQFPTAVSMLQEPLAAYRKDATRRALVLSGQQTYTKREEGLTKAFTEVYITQWVELGPKNHSEWYTRQTAKLDELLTKDFAEGEASEHIRAPLLAELTKEKDGRLTYYRDRNKEVYAEVALRQAFDKNARALYEGAIASNTMEADTVNGEVAALWQKEEQRRQAREDKFNKEFEKYAAVRDAKWGKIESFPIEQMYKDRISAYPKIAEHKDCAHFRVRTDLKLEKTLQFTETPDKENREWTTLLTVGEAKQNKQRAITRTGTVRGFACLGKRAVVVVDYGKVGANVTIDPQLNKTNVESAQTTTRRGFAFLFDGSRLKDILEVDGPNLSMGRVMVTENDMFTVLLSRIEENAFVTQFAFDINPRTGASGIRGGRFRVPTTSDPFVAPNN